jgi:ribosomal protein L11 methyltransferase
LSRQQLTLRIAAAQVAQIEALLELAGAEALSLRDAGDDPVLEPPPDSTPLWPNVVLRAQFAADIDLEPLGRLLQKAGAGHVEIETRQDSAWRHAQRQIFAARRIGKRLWLAPADDPTPPVGLTLVRLHMGLAFGTGEHATTALCLEWLEANLQRDTTILDYGCGSGVLAIAALALGSSRAWAVDNDPQALTATAQNAHLNGISGRLWVGAPDALPRVVVDVLAANILAGPLEELADDFAAHVGRGGTLVLSGILEAQLPRVAAAYTSAFENLTSTIRDGWVCLTGVRRNSS